MRVRAIELREHPDSAEGRLLGEGAILADARVVLWRVDTHELELHADVRSVLARNPGAVIVEV